VSRHTSRYAAVALTAAIALTASACSSSSSGSAGSTSAGGSSTVASSSSAASAAGPAGSTSAGGPSTVASSSSAASAAGPASSTSAGGSSTVASSSSDASAAGLAAAKAQLAKYRPLVSSFTGPGPALTNASSLRGKTITYVAAFLAAAYFQAQVKLVTQAADVVGAKVSVCDAKGTPTGASTCIMQGVQSGSVGIITDSITYAYANNAYAAAAAAGVPVVAADITDSVPASLVGHVTTMDFHESVVAPLAADEIIADSSGTANVLLVQQDDVGANTVIQESMKKEFEVHCPKCKVTQVLYHQGALQQLPTLVSTALQRTPDTNYLFFNYDSPAGPLVFQGMQTVHATNIKVVSLGAGVDGLQNVASGKQLADVNSDIASGAWNAVDLLFRMITKSTIPSPDAYKLPIRVFDSTNIKALTLSLDAYSRGDWWTNGAYRTGYRKLWAS
jgi:ribose transport system substrate-binding protein